MLLETVKMGRLDQKNLRNYLQDAGRAGFADNKRLGRDALDKDARSDYGRSDAQNSRRFSDISVELGELALINKLQVSKVAFGNNVIPIARCLSGQESRTSDRPGRLLDQRAHQRHGPRCALQLVAITTRTEGYLYD